MTVNDKLDVLKALLGETGAETQAADQNLRVIALQQAVRGVSHGRNVIEDAAAYYNFLSATTAPVATPEEKPAKAPTLTAVPQTLPKLSQAQAAALGVIIQKYATSLVLFRSTDLATELGVTRQMASIHVSNLVEKGYLRVEFGGQLVPLRHVDGSVYAPKPSEAWGTPDESTATTPPAPTLVAYVEPLTPIRKAIMKEAIDLFRETHKFVSPHKVQERMHGISTNMANYHFGWLTEHGYLTRLPNSRKWIPQLDITGQPLGKTVQKLPNGFAKGYKPMTAPLGEVGRVSQ